MTDGTVIIIGMGWLGSAVARSCLAAGMRVTGTVRNEPRSMEFDNQVVPLSQFTLGESLPKAIAEASPGGTAVISVPPSRTSLSPDAFERGLEKLARELTRYGVRRIVFVSATSVYPANISNPSERDAADLYSPRSGVSLYRGESSVRRGAGGCPVITLRFGGLFGPGRHPGRFFRKRPLRFPDDPVNLIHLDDCVGVIALAMTLESDIVVNAVAPGHPDRGIFYTTAALAVGEMPPVTVGIASSGIRRIINTDLLEKKLGYRFLHPDPLQLYL